MNPTVTQPPNSQSNILTPNPNPLSTNNHPWGDSMNPLTTQDRRTTLRLAFNIYWSTEHKHLLQRHSIEHLPTPRTVATSCTTHPSQSIFQPGGCLLLSNGQWTRRCHRTSTDPSGMGRWCHLRVEGRDNIVINIVCAYRPCAPSRTETSTSNTTYLQQL